MRDENGRHITGTLPEDADEEREAAAHRAALFKPQGLGDMVARVARAVGADRLAAAYTRITGKDCGCNQRRETLNRLFPYGKS